MYIVKLELLIWSVIEDKTRQALLYYEEIPSFFLKSSQSKAVRSRVKVSECQEPHAYTQMLARYTALQKQIC